jgi:cytochrome b involved in lipid metabolism
MSSELKKCLPPPYKKKQYYTMSEVALHNQANNCWVILFAQVFDLTGLIQHNIHSKS